MATNTPSQNKQLLDIARGFGVNFAMPNNPAQVPATTPINTTIDSTAIAANNTPVALPPAPVTTQAGAFVAGGVQPVPTATVVPTGVTPGISTNVGSLEQGQNMLRGRLSGLQNQMLGRGVEQQQLEAQAGIPQFNKELATLNDEYARKQAGFMQAEENYRSGGVGTQELATGKQAQIQRNEAVVLGGMGIQIMAKQGNIEAAQNEVDRVLDFKYEPIKQEIENTKYFIDLNYQDLSRADKIRADALDRALTREQTALKDFQDKQNMVLKKMLDENAPQDAYAAALNANNRGELAKVQANLTSQITGVPSEIAEKIGESKVGQKVNANIDFVSSLTRYKNLYKEYVDGGTLATVEAKKNLGALRNDLNQKYSVANGQGAVQEGDRDSYQKIISGGYFAPKKALQSMDTLIGSLNSSAQNDIKFLNSTYSNYATQFFAPQLENQSTDGNLTGASFFDSVLANIGNSAANISNIYNPSVGFVIPGK